SWHPRCQSRARPLQWARSLVAALLPSSRSVWPKTRGGTVMNRIKVLLLIGGGLLVIAGGAYATIIPVILTAGTTANAPLLAGPATYTFRQLTTTPGDVGTWHYHPGYVYNVVASGAIKIEDGCGHAATYSAGQAFETSEGRVHRAINEGAV